MVVGVNTLLKKLQYCLDRVRQYFLAKLKKVYGSKDEKTGERQIVEPLFSDMSSPKQDQVGFLLRLTCGHNRHPNPAESRLFTKHLEMAGFLKPVQLGPVEEIRQPSFSSPMKPLADKVKHRSKAEEENKDDGEPPSPEEESVESSNSN